MRNTTGTDFSSVGWNCKFYDKDGYKVGEGAAVFYLVRKQSVTFDTMTFPLNIGIGLVKKVNCDLNGVEKVTKTNARMYRPGRTRGTDGLGSSFWQGQRPYSKGEKNDYRDAEAIAEAVQRPTMKFVATKTADQLDLQAPGRVARHPGEAHRRALAAYVAHH